MAAMATYVRAGLPEVATALAALTGEPHPLAVTSSGADSANRQGAARTELDACHRGGGGPAGLRETASGIHLHWAIPAADWGPCRAGLDKNQKRKGSK
jgi:hypothetical protein